MFAAIWNLDFLECADENQMWTVIWQANIASPSLMAYAWRNEQWYLWFYAVAVKHSLTALYKQKLQFVFKLCSCLVLSVFLFAYDHKYLDFNFYMYSYSICNEIKN